MDAVQRAQLLGIRKLSRGLYIKDGKVWNSTKRQWELRSDLSLKTVSVSILDSMRLCAILDSNS